MPQFSFGQVINVTGPNNGFQGTVSRFGERVITAREFVPFTATNNLNFGDPAVIIPTATGGVFDSVADFLAIGAFTTARNPGLVAQFFAGMAVREVKTQLLDPAGQTPGILQVGFYANDQMAEVMERGNSVAVLGHDPNRHEVVLGNEFRPGVMVAGDYPYRDNLIAGAIDKNETALEAAVREMREETDLILSNPVLIHSGAYVRSGGTS